MADKTIEITENHFSFMEEPGSPNLDLETLRAKGDELRLQLEREQKLKEFLADFQKPKKKFFGKFSHKIEKSKSEIFGQSLDDLFQEIGGIPDFIHEIIRIIEEDHLKNRGLYRTSGSSISIKKLRVQLEKKKLKNLDDFRCDVDVLIGTMKQFFRELKKPLLNQKIVQEILNVGDVEDLPKILQNLTEAHRYTLYILLEHFLKVLEYTEENKMDCQNLATCWAPSLIYNTEVQTQDMIIQLAEPVKVLDQILSYYQENKKALTLLKPQVSSKDISNIKLIICTLEENLDEEGIYFKDGNSEKVEKLLKTIKDTSNYISAKKISSIDLAHVFRKYLKELNLIPDETVNFFETTKNSVTEEEILERIPKKEVLTLVLEHMQKVIEKVENIDVQKFIVLMSKNLADVECVDLVRFLLRENLYYLDITELDE